MNGTVVPFKSDTLVVAGAAAGAGAAGAAAGAGVAAAAGAGAGAPPLPAFSTSDAVILPFGPDPAIVAKSTPSF